MIRQPILLPFHRALTRRTLPAVLAVATLCTGCVSVQTTGGTVTYWVIPGYEGGDRFDRAGTTYTNSRWARYPDSHPAVAGTPPAEERSAENGSRSPSPVDGTVPAAVYPPYSTRTAREKAADGQTMGAVVGALAGAQAAGGPNARVAGVLIGSAVGALAGGKLADPCLPSPNSGSVWGALAGGWLGSMFGGGRAREAFIALGAAGGAIRGTEMGSGYEGTGRRCR